MVSLFKTLKRMLVKHSRISQNVPHKFEATPKYLKPIIFKLDKSGFKLKQLSLNTKRVICFSQYSLFFLWGIPFLFANQRIKKSVLLVLSYSIRSLILNKNSARFQIDEIIEQMINIGSFYIENSFWFKIIYGLKPMSDHDIQSKDFFSFLTSPWLAFFAELLTNIW